MTQQANQPKVKRSLSGADVDRYLTALLSSQLLLWTLDSLKDSPYYKQEVKYAANNLVKAIERHLLPDVALVTGINDSDLYNHLDEVKRLIKQSASLKTQYIGIVLEVMDRVEQNPDEVLKYFRITLIDEPNN